MRSNFSFCLALLLITISMVFVSVSQAGIQLWDFEKNGKEKDWEHANGDWEFKKGIFQEVSAAESAMHQSVRGVNWEKWDDYTVKAKIRPDEGAKWVGLVFRAQKDLHEYYVYYLNIPNNTSEFWVHMAGAWDTRRAVINKKTGNSNNPAQGGIKIEVGKWMDVKIVAKGSEFSFYINDKLQVVHQETTYKKGSVGVWCWVSKASFDDVMVEGESVTKTLAVDPQSKLAATWGNLKRSP